MRPSQIRAELLQEHAALRALIAETRVACLSASDEPTGRAELAACVARLAAAMRAHNLHEEELLREIVRAVDAWGPARVEIMDESHVAEHLQLYSALLGTNGASDAATAVRGVTAVLDRIAQHMSDEERVILGEDVLRDDAIAIDVISG